MPRGLLRVLTGLWIFTLTGCLQLETLIQLHEDGSATITERIRLSRRLLDAELGHTAGQNVLDCISREAASERSKLMGKGVTLVSHTVRDVEGAAKEAVAVFRISDVSDFRYVSPYLATPDYTNHTVLACQMFPVYESTWYGRRAGEMAVVFKPATSARRADQSTSGSPAPTPLDQQVHRDLRAVFADMLSDFHVRITFESYAPLRFRQYYTYRGMGARTRRFDLIDFSDKDLEKYGYPFLLNEEIMLELLSGQFDGQNIRDHVAEHGSNITLPVYHPRETPEIYFKPSRQLFDRYFVGKMLTFGERAGPPRVATFEEIGHREPPQKK